MLDFKQIEAQVSQALSEDLGSGDISAALIDPDSQLKAELLTRENCILCGQDWWDQVFDQLNPEISTRWHFNDGDKITADQKVCLITGPARAILSGERTAMNFIQTLSGTATQTSHLLADMNHPDCILLDTRKTIPGLRMAQKYAVRCGGGQNHRIGLFDAYLIKENHIHACGSISQAVERAKHQHLNLLLEVEVENLAELSEAVSAGCNRVLLDNFSLEQLQEAVSRYAGKVELEASGNIQSDTIHDVAQTGVDFISSGALTKHLKAIDFSLRFID